MTCLVCASPEGQITRRKRNACPVGVVICQECSQAITRAEVGISQRADGSFSVTDGRSVKQVKEVA